jgi:hypothetical protein
MPRYACFALLAFCLLPAPGAAADLCQYVALTGSGDDVVLANPCVSYDGAVVCQVVSPGTGASGVRVVVCYPGALGRQKTRQSLLLPWPTDFPKVVTST